MRQPQRRRRDLLAELPWPRKNWSTAYAPRGALRPLEGRSAPATPDLWPAAGRGDDALSLGDEKQQTGWPRCRATMLRPPRMAHDQPEVRMRTPHSRRGRDRENGAEEHRISRDMEEFEHEQPTDRRHAWDEGRSRPDHCGAVPRRKRGRAGWSSATRTSAPTPHPEALAQLRPASVRVGTVRRHSGHSTTARVPLGAPRPPPRVGLSRSPASSHRRPPRSSAAAWPARSQRSATPGPANLTSRPRPDRAQRGVSPQAIACERELALRERFNINGRRDRDRPPALRLGDRLTGTCTSCAAWRPLRRRRALLRRRQGGCDIRELAPRL